MQNSEKKEDREQATEDGKQMEQAEQELYGT
jgi:hypothetical protein